MDIFGQESNVNLENRILVFDIHDRSEQLKPAGLLVITDTILNRVNINWKQGRRTHIFIDEFHVVFGNEQGANFFDSAWRQFRKRGAYPTAITQNCEYLLNSPHCQYDAVNSECTIMLSQAASDRQELAKLLHISDDQMSYCTNTRPGCGLLKYGSALVPFINDFPENTRLYQLMTTKLGGACLAVAAMPRFAPGTVGGSKRRPWFPERLPGLQKAARSTQPSGPMGRGRPGRASSQAVARRRQRPTSCPIL